MKCLVEGHTAQVASCGSHLGGRAPDVALGAPPFSDLLSHSLSGCVSCAPSMPGTRPTGGGDSAVRSAKELDGTVVRIRRGSVMEVF